MFVSVDHLEYGPYLCVELVAPADGFLACFDDDTREAMEAKPFHPFTKLVHERIALGESPHTVLADFKLESERVGFRVIVADNPVVTALIAGIREPESINTGNSSADWYRADLIRALANLWD